MPSMDMQPVLLIKVGIFSSVLYVIPLPVLVSVYAHPCLFLRYKVWCHAGHVDRPLCDHVFAGEPGTAVPVLYFLVSAQHVSGRGQPLAAPAQVCPKHILSGNES